MKLDANDIRAAQQGDEQAMRSLLRHYDRYLSTLSLTGSESGSSMQTVNYDMKEQLQTALMEATLKFDVNRITYPQKPNKETKNEEKKEDHHAS